MPWQLQQPLGDAMAAGVIHSARVAILRGPIEEGAVWLEPAEIEVLTVALQRTPRCDRHEQYASMKEKAQVVQSVEEIFACAVELGVEALLFGPIGLTAGFYHPAADLGQLLREAASGELEVYVAKEQAEAVMGWSSFTEAVVEGRKAVRREPPVPLHLCLASEPFKAS